MEKFTTEKRQALITRLKPYFKKGTDKKLKNIHYTRDNKLEIVLMRDKRPMRLSVHGDFEGLTPDNFYNYDTIKIPNIAPLASEGDDGELGLRSIDVYNKKERNNANTSSEGVFSLTLDSLKDLAQYADKGNIRPQLSSIALCGENLVATNGHVLKGIIPLRWMAGNLERDSFVMPIQAFNAIIRLASLIGAKKHDTVKVAMNEVTFNVSLGAFTITCSYYNGYYIRYKSFLPTTYGEKIRIEIPEEIQSLKRLKTLIKPRQGIKEVTFTTQGGKVDISAKLLDNTIFKWEVGELRNDKLEVSITLNLDYLILASRNKKKFEIRFHSSKGLEVLSPIFINGAIVMPITLKK